MKRMTILPNQWWVGNRFGDADDGNKSGDDVDEQDGNNEKDYDDDDQPEVD